MDNIGTDNSVRRNSPHAGFISAIYVASIFIYLLQRIAYAQTQYLDEACCVLLLAYSIIKGFLFKNKEFRVFFGIAVFYLVYSLFFGANIHQAVFRDLLTWMKPFAAFYACWCCKYYLTDKWKRRMQRAAFVICCICVLFGIYYSQQAGAGYGIVENPNFYQMCVLGAFIYMLYSERTQHDWFMTFLLITPGLLTRKAKFIAAYVFFFLLAFVIKKKLRINVRTLVYIAIGGAFALYLTWDRFSIYFFLDDNNGVVRNALYTYGMDILKTWFPFGSGLGSWGTEATKYFYSPLYYVYGINNMWGGQPGSTGTGAFLADTFYPTLAQFGVVGVVLYFTFILRRWKELLTLDVSSHKFGLFVVFFILMQNVADAGTMLGPMCLPTLMTLGLITNRNTNIGVIYRKKRKKQ